MNKIEKLINESCPDGVELKELLEICVSLKKDTLTTEELSNTGEYPVINSGREWYGRYNKYNNNGNAISIAARGEYAGFINYISEKFWAGGLCYPYRSKDENIVKTKYIFYFLKNKQSDIMATLVARGGIPALNKTDLDKFKIPIPPLPIQEEIVRILDNFTQLEAELEAELEARKKQYNYYRDGLLTFGGDVEFKELDKIGINIFSGKNSTRMENGEYPVYGSTGIIGHTNQYVYDKKQILIARVGANAGFVHVGENKYDVSDNTLIIQIKDNINFKFLYYLLINCNLNQYAKGGGQPLITAGQLKSLKIAIPSIPEQERIVKILEKFDTLVNDISIGLPAELDARRKQYEYYREKLLTFKEKT